jgi:hypothetical protein
MAALYGGDADMRIEKERESFRVELRLPCSR